MLWDKNMSPLSLQPEESLDALLPKEVITGTPRTKTSAWARLRQMGLPFGKGCYVPPQDEGVVTLTLRLYAKLAGEEAVKNALDQECEKGHIASVIGVRKLPREKTPPEEWRRLSQEQQGKRKARRTFVALVTPTDKNLDASKVPKSQDDIPEPEAPKADNEEDDPRYDIRLMPLKKDGRGSIQAAFQNFLVGFNT